jgi:hypothetical protein
MRGGARITCSAKEGDPMDEPQLIPVFLPALVILLARAERNKALEQTGHATDGSS